MSTLTSFSSRSPTLLLSGLRAGLFALIIAGCPMPGHHSAIRDPQGEARLSALEVTGGGTMYPEFEPGVHHYAVRCEDSTTLRVTARTQRDHERLTLLHNDRESIGSIDEQIAVNADHDIAIRVSGREATETYYVHCIPPGFPDITIEKRTEAVTKGLLLMTPSVRRPDISFLAIVDNNGVPRWVREPDVRARNFRRYPDGRYSYSERGDDGNYHAVILDADLERIDTATIVPPLDPDATGGHDFLVTDDGNYLLMSYHPAQRDLSDFECENEDGSTRQCSTAEPTEDSVIQEVTPDGTQVFLWNSWDHMKIGDCTIHRFPNDYAHLNSLYELDDGDILASFRGCAQVLRIDRETGAVVWQLGGTLPMRENRPAPPGGTTRYLQVVGDPAGEFCGQHEATETASGSLLMFDNGNHCLGDRGNEPHFTRIVEYDISSDTTAAFVRQYVLPEEFGATTSAGGVVALTNGHWLITWGSGPKVAVSEVDTASNEVFRIRMSKDDQVFATYRVYREREQDVKIPLNLPS